MYIADTFNHRIRKLTISTGIITTIAGSGGTGAYSGDNGQATAALLNYPRDVAVASTGTSDSVNLVVTLERLTSFILYLGNVYIADNNNHRIRKVTVSTGIISTVAGTGTASYSGDNGQATSATLNYPIGIALDSLGSYLLRNSLFPSWSYIFSSSPR